MKTVLRAGVVAVLLAVGASAAVRADEALPGASVESLLTLAKERNPDYASMRHEADAAGARIEPAGALPDPKLRVELMDITQGGERNPNVLPNQVGSTVYTVMQDLPWFGKRDLKRAVAEAEAEGAQGRAAGTWAELSARIKTGYAQFYYVHRNLRLTREILDLMVRLEKVAQSRYVGGLAAQQDVIRAQVEQSNMRNELIALENEQRMVQARLNGLLARGSSAALAEPQQLRPLPPAARLEFGALEERVRARNPQLFADEAKLRAAQKSRDLAYKNRYPDFTVGIAPTQSGWRFKEWGLMLEMNIPIQQGVRRAQEHEAEAMLRAAHERKDATANQALADLAESLSALDAARRTEAIISGSLLPQAELTFKSALASYENGKVDFATLLDAQRQIRLARQNQIKTQTEQQTRLADIEKLLGEEL